MKRTSFLVLCAALAYQLLALPLYSLRPDDVLASLSLGPLLPGERIAPDFVLLVLVWFAVLDPTSRVLWAALSCGLIVDALSLDPWFAHALGYPVAVWFVRLPLRERWAEAFLPRLLVTALALVFAAAVRMAVLWLSQPRAASPALESFGLEILYDLLLSVPLFVLLDACRSRLIATPRRRLMEV